VLKKVKDMEIPGNNQALEAGFRHLKHDTDDLPAVIDEPAAYAHFRYKEHCAKNRLLVRRYLMLERKWRNWNFVETPVPHRQEPRFSFEQ
jgi:hypothetical protein